MKILITGANGLLGQYLVKGLVEEGGHQLLAVGRGPSRLPAELAEGFKYYNTDLTDGYAVEALVDAQGPDWVVHAAAMTQVDFCEQNRDLCFEVNVGGTENMLKAAEKSQSRFIYVSTDFIFDGVDGLYEEGHPPGPVNWYGSTKAQAEKLVADSSVAWAIARTCLVYGHGLGETRNNIVSWVKEKLEKGEPIKVVDDQVRTPTHVEDLAKGIIRMIQKSATGIYHLSGEDVLTPYQMALRTAAVFGLDSSLIEQVDASSFSQPARRPSRTGLRITKAKNELGFAPMGFEAALLKMYQK